MAADARAARVPNHGAHGRRVRRDDGVSATERDDTAGERAVESGKNSLTLDASGAGGPSLESLRTTVGRSRGRGQLGSDGPCAHLTGDWTDLKCQWSVIPKKNV